MNFAPNATSVASYRGAISTSGNGKAFDKLFEDIIDGDDTNEDLVTRLMRECADKHLDEDFSLDLMKMVFYLRESLQSMKEHYANDNWDYTYYRSADHASAYAPLAGGVGHVGNAAFEDATLDLKHRTHGLNSSHREHAKLRANPGKFRALLRTMRNQINNVKEDAAEADDKAKVLHKSFAYLDHVFDVEIKKEDETCCDVYCTPYKHMRDLGIFFEYHNTILDTLEVVYKITEWLAYAVAQTGEGTIGKERFTYVQNSAWFACSLAGEMARRVQRDIVPKNDTPDDLCPYVNLAVPAPAPPATNDTLSDHFTTAVQDVALTKAKQAGQAVQTVQQTGLQTIGNLVDLFYKFEKLIEQP